MTEYLAIKDICSMLHCSRQQVSRWCMPDRTGQAKLENVRIGKVIRVPREALEAFIARYMIRAVR